MLITHPPIHPNTHSDIPQTIIFHHFRCIPSGRQQIVRLLPCLSRDGHWGTQWSSCGEQVTPLHAMTYTLTHATKSVFPPFFLRFSSSILLFSCSYDSTSSIGSGGSIGPGNAGRHLPGGRGGSGRGNQPSHHGGGSAPFNPYMHNAPGGGPANPNPHHPSTGTTHFNPQVERRTNDRTMIYSSTQVPIYSYQHRHHHHHYYHCLHYYLNPQLFFLTYSLVYYTRSFSK